MALLPKMLVILLILVVLKETAAVRGALFRSGRAVPFERVPGQQKTAPVCREVELYVPCLFTYNRNCVIDKICVHESPVATQTTPISLTTTPNSKREGHRDSLSLFGPPRGNDFLRFGRAGMASGAGGTSDANGAQDEMKASFLRINGEPEIIFQ
ncbi:hypothetical protein GCK72_008194 [Caenorhabditis remanei]|nr:hypothetical protein GCK72_008194 [Caenorhabditis remanei]KAF1759949.1 hypothetical protein GCK72_008194 [Caenorhabditis remanei]